MTQPNLSRPTANANRRNDVIALALTTTVPTFAALTYFIWLTESAAAQAMYAASKVFLLLFPAIWFLTIERAPLTRPIWNARATFHGVAFALAVALAAAILYRFIPPHALESGALRSRADRFSLVNPTRYAAFAIFLSLFNSATEEYYWRWFVFNRFRRHFPPIPAALASAVAFAAHHLVILTIFFGALLGILFSLAVAIGGVFWALLYDRSRSLYACWISHLIVDAAVLAIGYRLLFP